MYTKKETAYRGAALWLILTAAMVGVSVALLLTSFVSLPSAEAQVISSTLRVGSSGAEVTRLQQFLAADSTIYPEGLVTGYYGPLTQQAVERYQCRQNIVCSGSPSTTGYGQVGPRTLATISGIGGPDPTDASAPIMGNATILANSATGTPATGVTITWNTSESARHRVMYSTSFPFVYANAPSVAGNSVGTSASVTVAGLQPNTTYYYVRESVDMAGNVMWTTRQTFTTSSSGFQFSANNGLTLQ